MNTEQDDLNNETINISADSYLKYDVDCADNELENETRNIISSLTETELNCLKLSFSDDIEINNDDIVNLQPETTPEIDTNKFMENIINEFGDDELTDLKATLEDIIEIENNDNPSAKHVQEIETDELKDETEYNIWDSRIGFVDTDELEPNLENRVRRKVWLDMDSMALFEKSDGLADQDDGFAAIAVMHCPDLFDIRGFSAVFGNGSIDETHKSLTKLVNIYYGEELKQIPPKVYKGAKTNLMVKLQTGHVAQAHLEIGIDNQASYAMIAELELLGEDEKMDFLATGPLTNVAEMILLLTQQKKTYLLKKIGKIYVCAGTRNVEQLFISGTKQPKPFPDMNFDFDPMSFLTLLQNHLDLVFAGYEIATHFWMTQNNLDSLTTDGDKIIRELASCNPVKNWIKLWLGWGNIWQQRKPHDTGVAMPGFHPFDFLTAMYMIAPHLFRAYKQEAYFGINHINHPGYQNKPVFKTYLLCAPHHSTTEIENWGVLARAKAVYVHNIRDEEKFNHIALELLKRTCKGVDFIE